ncbi:hypothetical protein V6N12_066927 [Hibiscus sabdariffa]
MVPRVENGDQIAGGLLAVDVPPISVGLTGSTEKKKRGRPRKYGPDGTMARALSPMPISSSIPPGTGDLAGTSFGTNFTPHIITVNPGEDVTMKVISFSQQGPRAICILSANGVISNVTLRQPEPDSSGGMLTYEGHFEILSLSGSFIPTETQGTTSRSGGMSVSLVSPDGRVVGGAVAGLLVVATPVQHDQQSKKLRNQSVPDAALLNPNIVDEPASNAENEDSVGVQHSQRNSNNPKQNFATTSFRTENWANMQEPRKFGINISLPAI